MLKTPTCWRGSKETEHSYISVWAGGNVKWHSNSETLVAGCCCFFNFWKLLEADFTLRPTATPLTSWTSQRRHSALHSPEEWVWPASQPLTHVSNNTDMIEGKLRAMRICIHKAAFCRCLWGIFKNYGGHCKYTTEENGKPCKTWAIHYKTLLWHNVSMYLKMFLSHKRKMLCIWWNRGGY